MCRKRGPLPPPVEAAPVKQKRLDWATPTVLRRQRLPWEPSQKKKKGPSPVWWIAGIILVLGVILKVVCYAGGGRSEGGES